ncbi:MAG: type VI secretion system baseplate subunit TssG [Gammaproteobacteria bacterium]|nr:type VI secretion system baseplate subunit TssG [Gammaproteobacteria bacterium]
MIPQLEQAGLRFSYRIDPQLAFPTREIQSLIFQKKQIHLSLNFMGLQGASTPLPIHYSELIIQDDPDESNLNTLYNFFNQQFFGQLLAIQQKYAYLPQLQVHHEDELTLKLLSFSGIHPMLFAHQEDYLRLLPFAPLLLGKQLSQSAWCHLIQQYFCCEKVWLKQWVPIKIKIPEGAQNRLGVNVSLGEQGSLGEYVKQAKNHAEIHLLIPKLEGFLPDQPCYQALKRLLGWITPTPTQFRIVLHIHQGNPLNFDKKLGLYLGWKSLLTKNKNPEMLIFLS